MKGTRQIVVTKSDGTLERFSVAKLSNCLAGVMREQAYDPRLSVPLARAIALHLGEWQGSSPPTTGYLYRCVRSVLQQTGLGHVADDLAAHRRTRRIRRRRTRVLDPSRSQTSSEPWCKAALVTTLQTRYGLRHPVSRFMAGRIEAQVFVLDYRVVSKPFLAELVQNEVLAWGLADDQVLGVGTAVGRPAVAPPLPRKEN